jgi:hypothetical protein
MLIFSFLAMKVIIKLVRSQRLPLVTVATWDVEVSKIISLGK